MTIRPTATVPADDTARTVVQPADPCTIVIFGAAGDLTRRLVVPALYNLARTGTLPTNFALIGVDLAENTAESWAARLREMLDSYIGNVSAELAAKSIDEAAWQRLVSCMRYVRGDMTSDALYQDIGHALDEASSSHATGGNAIFYLAVPDRFFGTVVEKLGKSGLTKQKKSGATRYWRRVVVEKPFGHDLKSATQLNAHILKTLSEDQIFRIDHFLGKETVQNIMTFRFANGFFEPVWNRDRIDHVQITVAETVGVEQRGKFYEATGALRDMVPNHVFSLLAMVAMEPPVGFGAKAIRDRKADLLAAIPAIDPSNAVRGQYGAGSVLGKPAMDYRSEPNVDPQSKVETYVAMRLEIDNWRWAGVPFFVRTGKHLERRVSEIAIRFKPAPYAIFENTKVDTIPPNWLVLRVAPDEGISLQFEAKRPGPEVDLVPVKMDFRYADWFPNTANVGYETLLYDVMTGDATLFMRADMVEHSWRIVQPILDAWTADDSPLPVYASGSEGPAQADAIITRDGSRAWRPLKAEDAPDGTPRHG